MGFLQPAPPPFDLDEWRARPFLARLKPNTQDWVLHGFGAPGVVYVLYTMKLIVFVAGGSIVTWATTPHLGALGAIGHWWAAPIVFQKLAVWTLLWEILGLGSGSMQLTGRFSPLIGGVLYWLRPGTVRLPPWPQTVPLTKGYRRTIGDVALYVAVLAAGIYVLVSSGERSVRRLQPAAIAVLLGLWLLLGLRDKVPFLAARPEVYGFVLLVSLFSPLNLIVGWQFVFFCIWAGAAMSKLNRHFPFVVAVMVSNTPWNRSHRMKEKLYRSYPDDLRPSRAVMLSAHVGTAYEFGLPLTMILTRGGTLQTIAVIGMIVFHAHIISTIPMGVPLEWNLFMIFGTALLFGHYGRIPYTTLTNPVLIVLLIVIGAVIPILGNLFPEKFSFLLSMRYYAGNWASSTWLFRKDTDAEGKLDRRVYKVAPIGVEQLASVYDRDTAQYVLEKGMAFRAMHGHGRALTGLLARAVDDVEGYVMRDGEILAGIVAGWNFGDGHFHDHHLLEAVQDQASFEPGELRAIMLESQPIQKQRQRYRIYDAADGLLEEGWVDVVEMCRRGPWLEGSWEFPVEVTWPKPNVSTQRAPV
ncbi:MAG TPA: DUF3556 domain-containing protein [Actinomycetota bacterium]|nr:DUF3556 domain-containing protein [Actinomycetota bacterium]